jgi:hypothetical protein
MKPLFLSGVIFAMLIFLLISSRVNLSLADDNNSKVKRE